MAQVPHVPPTHAWPPPHWLLAVHWVHAPLMQVRPACPPEGPPIPGVLQSSYDEHGPHVPLMHAWPLEQRFPGSFEQLSVLLAVHTPELQVWLELQSASWEHAHCVPVWVPWQFP